MAAPPGPKEMGRNVIKKMVIEDVEEVQAIDSSFLQPWSKKMWIEEFRSPLSHCYVMKRKEVKDSPRLIGFICFNHIGEESDLLNLGVHPHYRLKGIGRDLMNFYIDFCKQEGIKYFYLEVSVSNLPAIRLYQSFHYQIIGSRKKFYEGRVDALLMRRST